VTHLARVCTVAVTLAVVAACAGTPSAPEPPAQTTSATADVREEECDGAAVEVVDAVERLVGTYAAPALDAATEGSEPQSSAGVDPGDAADELGAAVERAQRTVDRLGCDPSAFNANVSAGLATITPSGPVATAVWRRVTASVLGEAEREPGERSVTGEEELLDAIARSAPGSTIVLPAGTTDLGGPIVLLDGLTLRGQGRDATTLVSSTAEAAVIVATDGLVALEDLTLRLESDDPASGLVAGPSASVALDRVRITGATRAEEDGAGGAGVFMSAEGDAGSGRGTTLEVTDSAFEDNAWAGIAVAGGHRVSIEGATLTDNGEVGILFLDSASGSVANSSFTGNRIGLAATGSARPIWLSSVVSGGSIGMQVDGSVEIRMQGMRVTGASSAAMLVGGEVTGAITDLTCEDTSYGIVVGDRAAPTLTDNDCPLARGG
jgi:parallel beta-helix repeat protein